MAAPRFARNNYHPLLPLPYRILPEIENFCLAIQPLLAAAFAADANVQRQSTQSLLEILFWFSNTIFTSAVNVNNLPIAQTPVQAQSLQTCTVQVNNVIQVVNAINVLFPQPNNASPTAPGESPLELALQTIAENGAPTFNNAWLTLQANPVGGNVPNGMPMVGMLATGLVAGNQTLVVATNESNWSTFDIANGLNRWLRSARNNAIPALDQASAVTRHTGVVQNLPALQTAWNNAAIGAKDGAVMGAWNAVNLPGGLPNSLTRPLVLSAMPFAPRWNGPGVPRCRRCRVVYRYNMGTAAVVEPELYNLGPYERPLSCAEVNCYQKCARYNM